MSDQDNNPSNLPAVTGAGATVMKLFSPPVVTALRYALTSIGPLAAMAGITALSPERITNIIATVQQIGAAVGAVFMLVGIVGPIVAGIYGIFKSTQKQQIKSAAVIAIGPKSDLAVEAQKVIISATNTIARDNSIPTSQEAKVAIIDAAAAQPEVVGTIHVTDQSLVDQTKSDQVQKVL